MPILSPMTLPSGMRPTGHIGFAVIPEGEWTVTGRAVLSQLERSFYATVFVFRTCAPGGNRNTSGSINNVGSNGNWWSSSVDGDSAWNRNLNSSNSGVNRNSNSQANGNSVRCLRDLIIICGIKGYLIKTFIPHYKEPLF